jgi:voltage-gated potassium channel
LTVIAKEFKSIVAAILMMLVLIIVAASLMYTLENEAQPEVFSKFPHSIWWSVVTMTTVGYGDVTPVTTLGKIVAAFIMLIGVGLVALPAGMLAARFGDELREPKLNLKAHIKHALADGVIDEDEYSSLEKLVGQLELKPEDLERSIALMKKGRSSDKCPHCDEQL